MAKVPHASALPLTLRPGVATSPPMSDSAPDSLIPYDEIVQEALRAVVGRVLGQIQSGGSQLPGAHHFYITFKTGAPGVDIPGHLRERFPDEMTIVLQNKFWDLNVSDTGFSVGLSFNQMASKLNPVSVTFRSQNLFCNTIVISSGKRSRKWPGISTPGAAVLNVM